MIRTVFSAHCRGCSKRLHAPSEESLRHQAERHGRNCNALKRLIPTPPAEVAESDADWRRRLAEAYAKGERDSMVRALDERVRELMPEADAT